MSCERAQRPAPAPRIAVHLGPDDLRRALRADALAGLTETPKELPPKWFYDEVGSALFEEITRLPEYYLTRREREILTSEASTIARLTRAETLVELGSGTSEKTRLLLGALAGEGTLRRFVPLDVNERVLRDSAVAIAARFPGLEVHGVVGDFERHLEHAPAAGNRLVAFLGSTIGNLKPPERARFLARVAGFLGPGGALLLGTDLVKDEARLVAAYDDARGVTAAFNLNLLSVLNRELGADFDPSAFEHVARWDPRHEWVELALRARAGQRVRVAALDLEVAFAAGEELRTEISAKFRRERVEEELGAAGLQLAGWWTDRRGDFALALATRAIR